MSFNYEDLVEQFPEDAVCAFCGKPNMHWDEEGFFYLSPDSKDARPEDGKAACKECCEGEPGRRHEALHGKGER